MSMIGKTLAHYEITGQLGKGGMGEVYQAKDQKLGRDVAIKVLPEEFARDTDRIARFQREAKLLASLNHPNIAAIYGLEASEGTNFLVLELVEGQTLADRIKAGPIPVEESLKLALQIAEALEAAHEKGVIHRDLKPANIKVTPDGKVKVLDFGLAKAFAGEQAELNLSNSPTLSNATTQQGVILGTAAYMSPEQARGETVDKKADIWAFGCVLFEMLTGRGMFEGRTVSDTLAAVLMREPEWKRLPPNLHPRIRLLLERCLEKDAKNRYGVISDARVDIQKALADPGGVFAQPVEAAEPRRKLRTILPWAAAALLLGLIIAGVAVWNLKPPEPRQVMRFDYELPEGQELNLRSPALAVSRDGKKFVYSTSKGLYLRSVDEMTAKLIAGTEGVTSQPLFSPDGKWVAYNSDYERKFKKIAIGGGAAVVLFETGSSIIYGVDWYADNAIVYGSLGGIMRISANGGTPEPFIKRTASIPLYPQMLPDGKSLLYSAGTSSDQSKVVVKSLKSGEQKELFAGFAAWYLPTGHLVYRLAHNNNLFAIPFDLNRLEVKGEPIPIVEGIMGNRTQYAISDEGTLAYIMGNTGLASSGLFNTLLVWVDREGKEQPLSAAPNLYGNPRISPDGTQVALHIGTGTNQNVWVWDIVRETMTRLTFEEGENSWPIWTQDGKRIVYRSSSDGVHYDINIKAADGSGKVEKLVSWPNLPGPFDWSRDGKTLLSWDLAVSPFQTNIAIMPLEGDHARKPLLQGKYYYDHPRISPDGRWLAYASNESGQDEIYVRPYPEVNNGRWQVSINGGDGPLWSPDGRELYYRNGESVMAVPVETRPIFKPGKPKALFRGTYFSVIVGQAVLSQWDISPDGKRFLMMKEATSTGKPAESPRKINIVLNWFEELKQRVPVK
jgi:serine/threonine-protein kinase